MGGLSEIVAILIRDYAVLWLGMAVNLGYS